jgi:hypothetical protein
MRLEHKGREQFLKGSFGGGGDNLFVDAGGVMRRIVDNDLNGDGHFDFVLPNSHGYIERGPTYIYILKEGEWEKCQLPHDSCWTPKVADVDGDGYLDLIIANGENGITSELPSYIYWGGPNGLTGERTDFQTTGAYVGVEVRKADGLDHAWKTLPCANCMGVKAVDIKGSGRLDIVTCHYCSETSYDAESLVFWNGENGHQPDNVTALETHGPMGCAAADFDNDGIMEIIFCNTMRGPSQYHPDFPVFAYFGTSDHKYLRKTAEIILLRTEAMPTRR